jgi:hypothetical protein
VAARKSPYDGQGSNQAQSRWGGHRKGASALPPVQFATGPLPSPPPAASEAPWLHLTVVHRKASRLQPRGTSSWCARRRRSSRKGLRPASAIMASRLLVRLCEFQRRARAGRGGLCNDSPRLCAPPRADDSVFRAGDDDDDEQRRKVSRTGKQLSKKEAKRMEELEANLRD